MKQLVPAYLLLSLMLAAIVTFGVLGLRKFNAIQAELIEIKLAESRPFGSDRFRTLQVEVVNTPTVEIENTPLDVTVDDPLNVNVVNEPDVNCNHY